MATVEVCAAIGVANVTVAHVVTRAGVSRRTFYEHFSGCEECVLGAVERTLESVSVHVIEAYEQGSRWRERIRFGLGALLECFDREPAVARLLIVESLGAGPRALERRSEVLARVSAVIDDGRREEGAARRPPPLAAEGIVGAVASVLHTRLLDGEREPLRELTNALMGIVVLPYLGPSVARQELRVKQARRQDVVAPSNGHDALARLEMRMTYRTMRVMLAIGQRPGSSNREIGAAAGAEDQGQVSKLLARLKRLGLIENEAEGEGGSRGAPNAWVLTAEGGRVQRTIAGPARASEG